jgi:Zn-dependent protease
VKPAAATRAAAENRTRVQTPGSCVKDNTIQRLHKPAKSIHLSPMASSQPGSLRFFRVAGVQVYIHWSWFIVAWIVVSTRSHVYSSTVWNVAEYLALFLIVLLHEFGHIAACRQVGGLANEIVLWPLGGVALGRPPPRAAAELWTIAAGPLVNVVLWPVFYGAMWWSAHAGWGDSNPDLARFVFMLWLINTSLLVFNLLPIYPLDGGQILRSLLWFKLGRARSLQVAAIVGLIGIVLAAIFLLLRDRGTLWTLIMALFLAQQCYAGLQHSKSLLALERRPRHTGFSCPTCGQPPPGGPLWRCASCGNGFDAFSTRGVCPHCASVQDVIPCAHCGHAHSIARWESRPAPRRGDAPVIDV